MYGFNRNIFTQLVFEFKISKFVSQVIYFMSNVRYPKKFLQNFANQMRQVLIRWYFLFCGHIRIHVMKVIYTCYTSFEEILGTVFWISSILQLLYSILLLNLQFYFVFFLTYILIQINQWLLVPAIPLSLLYHNLMFKILLKTKFYIVLKEKC